MDNRDHRDNEGGSHQSHHNRQLGHAEVDTTGLQPPAKKICLDKGNLEYHHAGELVEAEPSFQANDDKVEADLLNVTEDDDKSDQISTLVPHQGGLPNVVYEDSCSICFESEAASNLFIGKACISNCKACTTCMQMFLDKQVQIGQIPSCPDRCSYLEWDECEQFLSAEKAVLYKDRFKEAQIPFSIRLYCPYRDCSFPMDKSVLYGSLDKSKAGGLATGKLKDCTKCCRPFCVECEVPWHKGLACEEYQELPDTNKDAVDVQSQSLLKLAKDETWTRCKNCGTTYNRDGGCPHMVCTIPFCGHEWCFQCGEEYVFCRCRGQGDGCVQHWRVVGRVENHHLPFERLGPESNSDGSEFEPDSESDSDGSVFEPDSESDSEGSGLHSDSDFYGSYLGSDSDSPDSQSDGSESDLDSSDSESDSDGSDEGQILMV